MHQISTKSSESFEVSFESIIEKIMTSITLKRQTSYLNKINNSNSTIFESSQTFTFISRMFSENSIQNSDLNEFDQSIEKIDFILKKIDLADEKSINFSLNIAAKNSKQTNRKRKANQSSI